MSCTGESRRVEAIQIVADSGPNADENHLRRLLAEGLRVETKLKFFKAIDQPNG